MESPEEVRSSEPKYVRVSVKGFEGREKSLIEVPLNFVVFRDRISLDARVMSFAIFPVLEFLFLQEPVAGQNLPLGRRDSRFYPDRRVFIRTGRHERSIEFTGAMEGFGGVGVRIFSLPYASFWRIKRTIRATFPGVLEEVYKTAGLMYDRHD